ncbi:hypothetical protein N7462_009849, partial [Penicillium macrosclerotiorum]|uniref:uncharacterized protein n=1 Tax=Penicillium macrosclerotiorum TaxID=303699 RepID=UPI0025483351
PKYHALLKIACSIWPGWKSTSSHPWAAPHWNPVEIIHPRLHSPQPWRTKGGGRRTDSPFWPGQAASLNQGASNAYGQNLVVGASYSHANIPQGAPSNPRPKTPPRASAANAPYPASHLTNRSGNVVASPPRAPYPGIMAQGVDEWSRDPTEEDDDDDDDDDEIVYDDDEDEFGLPSLASMRRKKSAPFSAKHVDLGGTMGGIPLLWVLDWRQITDSAPTARTLPKNVAPRCTLRHGRAKAKSFDRSIRISYKEREIHTSRISRINKFKRILQASTVSLTELRDLAWSGVPEEVRPMTWQLLLGYLPTNSERRISTLERKRKEYLDGVRQAFERGSGAAAGNPPASSTPGRGRGLDEAIWHQISIDVPRTSPHIPLYGYEATQRSLERILYVWAIRHPASGYVQGINDLVTPFWQVFLGVYITDLNVEEGMDPGQLPRSVLDAVEADTFWCLTKLLDGIQDNYIYAQPGIHRQVRALRDLTKRIDSALAAHLEQEGVEFMQFSFRWMNCLLMREMSIKNTIRMWDTYMAEEQGFSRFHLYVCAAFLVKWTDQLVKMDFQEVMMFLQALPTKDWTEKDIELLLSEAFIWQSLFQDSRAHLRPTGNEPPENGIFY